MFIDFVIFLLAVSSAVASWCCPGQITGAISFAVFGAAVGSTFKGISERKLWLEVLEKKSLLQVNQFFKLQDVEARLEKAAKYIEALEQSNLSLKEELKGAQVPTNLQRAYQRAILEHEKRKQARVAAGAEIEKENGESDEHF